MKNQNWNLDWRRRSSKVKKRVSFTIKAKNKEVKIHPIFVQGRGKTVSVTKKGYYNILKNVKHDSPFSFVPLLLNCTHYVLDIKSKKYQELKKQNKKGSFLSGF